MNEIHPTRKPLLTNFYHWLSTSSSSLHEWRNTSDEKTLVDESLHSGLTHLIQIINFELSFHKWNTSARKPFFDEPLQAGSMKYIYEKTHGWWTSKRRFGTRDIDYQLRVKPSWMKYIRRENPWSQASKFLFSQCWHALSTSSSAFTNEIRPTRKP
jgi:hypothetical protein